MKLILNVCYGGLIEQREVLQRLAKSTIDENDRQELLGLDNLLAWTLHGFEEGYTAVHLIVRGTDGAYRWTAKNEPRKVIGYVPKRFSLRYQLRKLPER